MRRFGKLSVVAVGLFIAVSSSAANLMQVYREGLQNDPTFKAAVAQAMSQKEDVPISLSALLPQISGEANVQRQFIRNRSPGNPLDNDTTFINNQQTYSISLDQSIFNSGLWMSLKSASASKKAAEADINAAAQDLMVRVGTAYFNVLLAAADLRFAAAEKSAVGRQLEQTRQQFEVGMVAVTSYREAQAAYDTALAKVIANRNALSDSMEELRAITSSSYRTISDFRNHVPLMTPNPRDIDQWVNAAVRQNYTLLAARYTACATHATIGEARAQHLPTLDGFGQYTYNKTSNALGNDISASRYTGVIGLDARLPIFSGGGVVATTQQNIYNYEQAAAQEVGTYRSVVAETRKAYLGVVSGVSQVRADKQAIVSNMSSLDATIAAYDVGTRTMVDVLNAQRDLFQTQEAFANDVTSYVVSTLELKRQAGTLKVADLQKINSWLRGILNIARLTTAPNEERAYQKSGVIELKKIHEITDAQELGKQAKLKHKQTIAALKKRIQKIITKRHHHG